MSRSSNLLRPLTLAALLAACLAQTVNKVHLGFPVAWDGDRFKELYCPSKNIPRFLDGYFLCQLSASYGNSSAPPGHRLNHMIDAIGAVGAFHISNGQVSFSAEYYPSRPYKIWEFYDRNMSKSSVPWAGWSDYNLSAMARWEQVPANVDSARFHPNLDFWKIGKRVVAGTEAPYWVGYEFDVRNLDKFKLYPFTEENDVFGAPRSTMIPITMAIHERADANGTVWGTFSAMNFDDQRFYQGVFTVDEHGVRRVVGVHDYGAWDTQACGKDDEYIGDKTLLPGYVHSITSTENFVIIPVTSLLINPCKFKEPPMTNYRSSIQNGGLWGMDFYDMVPMRFIVFNKNTKQFETTKPLEVFPSMFVTHQLNAFESNDGSITADMVVYENHDPYIKYFYTDFLTSQLYPSTARILRFTLDVKEQRVMYNYLIPQETIAADFPQTNHGFDGGSYQWAYVVVHPFAADNRILKMNVDDPTGARNVVFKSEPQLVLHEPWFVARPDAKREDDGVLLVRALDLQENKGVLLVIDAATMSEIGRAYVPISIPFGFHNRYFSSAELGLPEGVTREISSNLHHRPANETKPLATFPTLRPDRTRFQTPSTRMTTEATSTSSTTTTTTSSTSTTTTPTPTTTSSASSTATTTTTPAPSPSTSSTTNPPSTTTMADQHEAATEKSTTSMPTFIKVTATSRAGRWWPLPTAAAELPWWQRIQHGKNTQQPLFPAEAQVAPGAPTAAPLSPTSSVVVPVQPSAMSTFYEHTLRTLCRWLPRVVSLVSSDVCYEQANNAARWVAPIASDYAERLRELPRILLQAQTAQRAPTRRGSQPPQPQPPQMQQP